MDEATECN